MKKILIATLFMIALIIGIVVVAQSQNDWEWIDTGFDYILYDISFPEGQSNIGFAVGSTSTYNGDGIILKTTDSGFTWEQISDPSIPGLEAIYFTDMNTGYIGGWDNYFAKTTDGGATWTEITINPSTWYFVDIEFRDADHGIAIAWPAEVYVTADAGVTWTPASGVTAGIHDLTYASDNVVYAACGDEKILKSTDGGLNWSEVYSGLFTYVFVGVGFLDENFGMVGGEDGKILITDDGGTTWTTHNTSNFHLWHGIFIYNQDSAYIAGTPEGVYKTTDGGSTWIDDYPQSNYNVAFYKILFTPDNNTGFVCGSQGIIMRKEGVTSAPALSVTPGEIVYPQTWVGETVDAIITIGNTGNALLNVSNISSDHAAFYTNITAFDVEPGMDQEVVVTFEPDDEGYFTGILSIESNDPENPVFEVNLQGEGLMQQAVISVPETLHFDTTLINNSSSKILEVWNIGNALLEVTEVTTSSSVFWPDITNFTLEPGNSEEIILSFSPDTPGDYEETLEIVSNDESSPAEISLIGYAALETGIIGKARQADLSAFPNPFESEVKIIATHQLSGNNSLKIINLLGKKMKKIYPESTAAQETTYFWDGTNDAGEIAPDGIYFGLIEGEKKGSTIKIIKH